MTTLYEIPELVSLRSSDQLIRIPPGIDVPLTPRVRSLIDSQAFRRLSKISQLGLVRHVYPGAVHTRQEHSLGVYRTALDYLNHLAGDKKFTDLVTPKAAEHFIVAALLHDIGHWPFCHSFEDLGLPNVPEHEHLAERLLTSGEIAEILKTEWDIDPQAVVRILTEQSTTPASKLLESMISSPIDVDKMDYLSRDSLHAGVPYGQNFDRSRLIHCLCLNQAGDGLAITEKGKTAAEMMVFARYVMFSEVYWHHAVRSATAMLQRAFYLLFDQLDLSQIYRTNEPEMITQLKSLASTQDSPAAANLLEGIFGESRQLYKRVAQFSLIESPELYDQLTRKPFSWLVQCAEGLTDRLSEELGIEIAAHEILFDAPPIQLEVDVNMEVYQVKRQTYHTLSDLSPVVRSLAQQQFDDYVKRVRIFVHPRLASQIREHKPLLQTVSLVVTDLATRC